MSQWSDFVALIAQKTDQDAAARIQEKARILLGGCRLTIPKREQVTAADAHRLVREHGGDVKKAAKAARLHPVSMYRRLRQAPDRGYRGRGASSGSYEQ